jgi:GNAT superfamily N-acetyltransferase
MDTEGLLGRMGGSITHFYGLVAAASDGASVIQFPGVLGCVCPAVPERSIFNSIAYGGHSALRAAIDELAATYEDAGVRAWVVWAPEEDRQSAKLLAQAGHVVVARPRAMGMRLSDFPPAEPRSLEWAQPQSIDGLARVNDGAYGFSPDTFARGLSDFRTEEANIFEAHLDGEAVAALMTVDFDGDCGVYFVATVPDAQGKGLISRLLQVALAAARERGCDTATLQATRAGRPVYERLGFTDLMGLLMWERRT